MLASAHTFVSPSTHARPLLTFGLLYLSASLSLTILLFARAENGDASLGLNLITPAFALGHHVLALLFLHLRHWHHHNDGSDRGRPKERTRLVLASHLSQHQQAGPSIDMDHTLALSSWGLAVTYTLATLFTVGATFAYWSLLQDVQCRVKAPFGGASHVFGSGPLSGHEFGSAARRWIQCEDPRAMISVVVQAALGVLETVVAWMLWRQFVGSASTPSREVDVEMYMEKEKGTPTVAEHMEEMMLRATARIQNEGLGSYSSDRTGSLDGLQSDGEEQTEIVVYSPTGVSLFKILHAAILLTHAIRLHNTSTGPHWSAGCTVTSTFSINMDFRTEGMLLDLLLDSFSLHVLASLEPAFASLDGLSRATAAFEPFLRNAITYCTCTSPGTVHA
jgi:hypothetical protein